MSKTWIIGASCLILAICLMIWGFSAPQPASPGREKYFAIMTEDRGTDVMQFKQGAQVAADELQASIGFLTCAPDRPVREEVARLLETLAQQKPDGVILPFADEQTAAAASAFAEAQSVRIVVLADVEKKGIATVRTDYAALGNALGHRAKEQGNLLQCAVVMKSFQEEAMMCDGIVDALGDVRVFRCESGQDALDALSGLPKDTVVFSLNADLTLAIVEDLDHLALWSVDPGETRAKLLKDGDVRGIAFHMPYAEGYQAVRSLFTGKSSVVPLRVVIREEMFLSENVKLVFPLLQ